jgi:hypothetical protein
MKKLIAISIIAISTASAHATAGSNSSKEYKQAYSCAMESFTSGYGAGPAAFCVGNSRDPSNVEAQAYKNAEIDFQRKPRSAPNGPGACTFAYASYIANGSHADNFLEGRQRIDNMNQVVRLMGSRDISLFDKNNELIPGATASQWFKKKGAYDWTLTAQALKTCSKKQIG